jgi:hypothetical protein
VKKKQVKICLVIFVWLSIPLTLTAQACDLADQDQSEPCQIDSQSAIAVIESFLQQQRYVEATDQLEKILMLDPQNQTLEQAYRQLLTHQQTQAGQIGELPDTSATTTHQWQASGDLQIRGGYSNNFNRAPLQSEFTLTIPNNPIRVQLSPEFRPKVGLGNDIQLNAKAYKHYTDQLDWQLAGAFQSRQTGQDGYSDYQSGAIASAWYHKLQQGGGYALTLAGNTQHYANDINIYLIQAQLKRIWKAGNACHIAAGIESYWQHQGNTNNLDGSYAGGITSISCDIKQINYQALIGSGIDWATNQRLGGDQWRSRVALQTQLPIDFIKDNALLKISGTYQANQDQQSYSSLINNGQTRQYMRYELGLDIELPMPELLKNLKAVTAVSWQRQDSTIDIFKINILEAWLGVKISL